ncbi:MAG: metallophosphoesterase [Candidatus Wallbacteria bacterium HGW-Wallbacteria-1]|jgi:predicted phosphodiesterase|uniref:Metallophosphoesterase n=1 Tax=Candidatus Wallbacteria bacterium HGW-Wallbacteria-1 TaxID=2013854 RepID=A0A2N1PRI0_9BACT|nr:MAG: metallophosphoesterase [Candidatus Wallbacteria bacterium HGW-Wallbacteria-1]
MRYLVISDIHSNEEAFGAVLDHACEKGWDSILCLGDLTGYNPNPNDIVDRIRTLDSEHLVSGVILGNHDQVVAGHVDPDNFNSKARQVALWQRSRISEMNRDYLSALGSAKRVGDSILIVHGSPADPDEYLTLLYQAAMSFRNLMELEVEICLNGHTHVPCVFTLNGDLVEKFTISGNHTEISLEPNRRYIINPGSVGQPRDGNPMASYGILDTSQKTFTFCRVEYDWRITREKILREGLPSELGERLGYGF